MQILAPLPERNPATLKAWDDDLNVLQPLAAGQVLIEGGLQLPGRVRRWSTLAPPELRIVTSHAERLNVVIRQTRALDGDPQPELQQALAGPTALIDLSYLVLPDGDYEIRVDSGPGSGKLTLLGQVLLRLRSADTPNPLAAPPEHRPLNEQDGPPLAPTAVPTRVFSLVPAWWSARQHNRAPAGSTEHGRVRLVARGRPTAPCFETGKHHLDYPTFYGQAGSGSIEGTCRGCGLVKRSPASYRPTDGHTSKTHRDAPALRVASAPEVQHSRALNSDTVLDALSHDVRGPLSGLERLAAQLEDSPLFTRELTNNLLALGHLRLRAAPDSTTLTDWEIATSTLQQTGTDTFVLVGARSRRLLSALTAAADAVGAKTEQRQQAAGPAQVLVHASAALARELTDHLTRAGCTVKLTVDTPEQLVATAPAMSSLLADLPRRAAPSASSVQDWHNGIARWRPALTFSAPGAYQLQTGGRATYCVRDTDDVETGRMRPGDVTVVKHGAALLEHAPLIGYDLTEESLYVPLGADLPAPYARVAVACSGLVPQVLRNQGLLLYPAVPPAIARRLYDLLSS